MNLETLVKLMAEREADPLPGPFGEISCPGPARWLGDRSSGTWEWALEHRGKILLRCGISQVAEEYRRVVRGAYYGHAFQECCGVWVCAEKPMPHCTCCSV